MKPIYTLPVILIAISLSACSVIESGKKFDTPEPQLVSSGTTGEPLIAPEPAIPEDITYTVEPGDMLSGIAKKMTGDGENWRKIAPYNGIADPGQLNAGDVIMIPGYMLRDSEKDLPIVQTIADTETDNNDSDDQNPDPDPAITESVAENESSASDQPETDQAASVTSRVIVEGSYYPKAIYAQPDYIGGLLVRVRPGTILDYLSDINDWVEVQTEIGIGYIHRSDVRKIEERELSATSDNEF